MLVVFSGRPLALAPYVDKAAAVVQAWYPGVEQEPALVDVLTGAADFAGRLTVSLPRSVGQLPLYYNALNTGRPPEGPVTGDDRYRSRYLDEHATSLFPFGHGLSYTQFAYSPVAISARSASARDPRIGIHVCATITNVGARDGVEVAQLYIRRRGTSVALPVRELKGYRRVALGAGESSELAWTLGAAELAFWNADMRHIVEPATVTVSIAPDARSGIGADFGITE